MSDRDERGRSDAAGANTIFLTDTEPLEPGDAVAAILTVGGRYLMQLRDDRRGIFYPDHWGLFGGGIERGESEGEALLRELDEELGLVVSPDEIKRFTSITFDLAFAGGPTVIRAFYEIPIAAARLDGLSVREGRGMALFTTNQALAPGRKVAPYDAFALWLHANGGRLRFPE